MGYHKPCPTYLNAQDFLEVKFIEEIIFGCERMRFWFCIHIYLGVDYLESENNEICPIKTIVNWIVTGIMRTWNEL